MRVFAHNTHEPGRLVISVEHIFNIFMRTLQAAGHPPDHHDEGIFISMSKVAHEVNLRWQ